MTDRRLAYLDALGIPSYQRRGLEAPAPETVPAEPSLAKPEPSPAPVREAPVAEQKSKAPDARPAPQSRKRRVGVSVGPGQGACLFLCAAGEDTASPLASDLARLLPEAPVWGVLASEGLDESSTKDAALERVIAERLFSQVVVFGEAQAELLFDDAVPERCGPARVTVVPDLGRLGLDGQARKRCWIALKSAGGLVRV